MSCEALATDDGGLAFLCVRGLRAPRKRCAFCAQRATVQCDGDRCIRPICDDHRWTAAAEFDLCPPCEAHVMLAARLPVQIELFG